MSNQNATDDTEVLIVEDERRLADVFAIQLAKEYTVQTAYTGEEALDVLHPGVDVVLLDRRLPGISGLEVLEEIRTRDVDCRVAIVSAVKPGEEVRTHDIDEYVRKPISCEELARLVEDLSRRQSPAPANAPRTALENANAHGRTASQLARPQISISETDCRSD